MSYGYSLRIHNLNGNGPDMHLGVQLGRVCIRKGIPVAAVAERLAVTRQTVYNWFTGYSNPNPRKAVEIRQYIKSFAG